MPPDPPPSIPTFRFILYFIVPVCSWFFCLSFGHLSRLLFAIQDAIIKEMSAAYPMHEIMTIRGLIAIPILLLLIHFSVRLSTNRLHHPGYHLLRGTLMFCAFMAFYVGLTEISLTTAKHGIAKSSAQLKRSADRLPEFPSRLPAGRPVGILAQSFFDGQEFLYRLTKTLSTEDMN